MSGNLFDDDLEADDDLFQQDGPGLFDEPVAQEGPDLFAADPGAGADPGAAAPGGAQPGVAEEVELAAPASRRQERPVDTAVPPPLALYRRYRPDTFADVIGQEHVTEPLQRALVNNRVNHAYLFSGPRGCGKTTSARILARCLNCEQGPTPTPCGECQSCRDLARGGAGSIDVIEIDAASHGGVDDARDLRERAFFAPVSSRYKIYIIDEAHMVSKEGFNALLKLVEEPPPHVKFIFATTEPEKVIGTIRSRTHHYPFRLVPPKVLTGYLASLCEQEGVSVDHAVLPLVVRAGAGSVRDSLSVLDQLLGGAQDGGVSYEHASALLGYTPDSLLDRIVDAFAAGDSSEVFATIDAVVEQGQDPRRFAEDLLRRLRDLVVVAAVEDAISSGLVDVAADQAERLQNQAAGLGLGELTRAAEVIANGLTEMRGTTAPRLHLELMCARVLLPGADVDERGIHARLERLERRVGMGDPAAPAAASAPWRLAEPEAPAAPPSRAQATPASTRPDAAERSESAHPEPAQPGSAPEAAAGPDGPDRAQGWEGHAGTAPTRTSGAEAGTADAPPPDVVEQVRSRPAGVEEAPATQAEAASHPTTAPAPSAPDSARHEPEGSTVTDAPAAPPTSPAPQGDRFGVADMRRVWPTVLEAVKERRRFTWIMLSQNAQVLDVQGNVLTLGFANAGARDSWDRGGNADVLADVLVDVVGGQFRVEGVVDGAAPSQVHRAPEPTAARPAPSAAPPEALQRARESIRPTRSEPVRHDEPDEEPELSRDDPDLDVAPMSSDELLRGVLGAQRITDEDA